MLCKPSFFFFHQGTSSTLPTEGSRTPPVTSDLSTQHLAAAQVASEVERILPRINDLPAVPSSSVNIHGNVFNMYVTGRHDIVPPHPMIIPLVVRHELSKLLNGPRVTHDDWKGLASALQLEDYIASLTNKPDPTADLIDLAEEQKKICSLEDLRHILKQMKRDDCVDVLDAGASVESNNRLMVKEKVKFWEELKNNLWTLSCLLCKCGRTSDNTCSLKSMALQMPSYSKYVI